MLARRASRGAMAMFISIADIFFGMAGIIMILIVLSSSTTERLVPDYLDRFFGCQMEEDGEPGLVGPDGQLVPVADWLAQLPSGTLIQKVGIQAVPGQIDCFVAAEKAFRAHNISLDESNSDKPVLSASLLLTLEDGSDED